MHDYVAANDLVHEVIGPASPYDHELLVKVREIVVAKENSAARDEPQKPKRVSDSSCGERGQSGELPLRAWF